MTPLAPFEIPDLATSWAGRRAYFIDTTDSTQSEVLKLAGRFPHGTVVVADHQTRGKGRRSRSWISLPGKQLMFSLLLYPEFPSSRFPLLSLAAGLAAAEALEETAPPLKAGLKWPNDVFVGDRKIGGILSEAILAAAGRPTAMIVGVGINVQGTEEALPEEIRSLATTVEMAAGPVDRLRILAHFLKGFEKGYAAVRESRTELLQREFGNRWVYRGRAIRIDTGEGWIEGVSDGVDTDGALLVRKAGEAGLVRVLAGDVVCVRGGGAS